MGHIAFHGDLIEQCLGMAFESGCRRGGYSKDGCGPWTADSERSRCFCFSRKKLKIFSLSF